jgi:ABC-type nitrate/sulfonate/bicarbonate transport system substrate-binding protein
MTGKFRILTACVAALLLLGLVAGARAETDKVRLGVGFALAYAPLYVAKEKGFFREEGVDVEFVKIEIAPDMIQSIIGGSTDAGTPGSFALITFIARGAPVSAVAYYGYGGDRIALAAHKDSGINAITDLYGKRLAVQTGTIGAQMWSNMVKVEGLDASKIDVKNIRNLDLPAAIASRSIDALITWEPNPTVLEERGLVKVIQRAGKYQQSYGAVIFGNEFMEKNPDTVRRFVKAHFRAAKFIRDNPREAAEINAQYVKGASVETIQKSQQYMVFDPRVTEASVKELDADIAFMKENSRLSGDVSGKDIVNSKFSDAVIKANPELVSDLQR